MTKHPQCCEIREGREETEARRGTSERELFCPSSWWGVALSIHVNLLMSIIAQNPPPEHMRTYKTGENKMSET